MDPKNIDRFPYDLFMTSERLGLCMSIEQTDLVHAGGRPYSISTSFTSTVNDKQEESASESTSH